MIAPKDIYALIIGINDYSNRSKLQGAVNDANQFEEHLTKANGVPSTNIKKLLDGQATRAAIISELESLASSENIEKDKSAIIIFFAGHGASSPAPADWPEWATVGGGVEQLCSVDIGHSESTLDKNIIEGIPDYSIRVLLDNIAQAKGNNITMFLDCCHAAGMNRDAENVLRSPDWIQRSIDDPPPLTVGSFKADSSLSRSNSQAGELPKADRLLLGTLPARESHIQVAACSSGQRAHECSGHGLFTAALLQVLCAHPLGTLTYQSLMHRLHLNSTPENSQTPLCDGTFIRRRLFDSMSPEADPALILCRYDRVSTQFTLMAGSLLGVTVGSEYKIFDTDLPDVSSSETALTAIVRRVEPRESILAPFDTTHANGQSPDPPIDEICYARLTKMASTELRLFCSDEHYLADVLETHKDDTRPAISLVQVYHLADADLVLTLNGENVSFERGSKTIIVALETGLPAQLSRQAARNDVSYVRSVIDSYARFLSYLSLTWPIPDGKDLVEVSFKRLEKYCGKIKPTSEDLLASGLNSDTTVYVDPTAYYGLTVKNITGLPLFVYIFCFCPDTFEITLVYGPQLADGNSSTSGDALEPGQVLAIGYGNGAIPALKFTSNCKPVDVSLLKIFVSARAMNDSLGSLVQPSPFKISRGSVDTSASWPDDFELEAEKDKDSSMTKIITVVQTRKAS